MIKSYRLGNKLTGILPVLSGHPRGMAKRPLNRGDRSIEVKITVSKGERNFRGLLQLTA